METPPGRRVRPFDLLILVIVALAAGGAWLALFKGQPTATLQKAAAPSSDQRVDVAIQDEDPTLGPSEAPVTIIEFSDFECPFCQSFVPAVKQALATYKDQVRLVYKDFPLEQIHTQAKPAAIAAQCVADLAGDKAFFEFHDGLFERQSELGPKLFTELAKNIDGLEQAEFQQCVDQERTRNEVEDDYQAGLKAGVKGTPATYVNGRAVEGADPDSLTAAIDAELKK